MDSPGPNRDGTESRSTQPDCIDGKGLWRSTVSNNIVISLDVAGASERRLLNGAVPTGMTGFYESNREVCFLQRKLLTVHIPTNLTKELIHEIRHSA